MCVCVSVLLACVIICGAAAYAMHPFDLCYRSIGPSFYFSPYSRLLISILSRTYRCGESVVLLLLFHVLYVLELRAQAIRFLLAINWLTDDIDYIEKWR